MHRRVELASRHRGPANLTRQRSHRTGAPGGAAAAIQRRHVITQVRRIHLCVADKLAAVVRVAAMA